LSPVQAGSRLGASRTSYRFGVDAERGEEIVSGRRCIEMLVIETQVIVSDESLVDRDGKLAGEVVSLTAEGSVSEAGPPLRLSL